MKPTQRHRQPQRQLPATEPLHLLLRLHTPNLLLPHLHRRLTLSLLRRPHLTLSHPRRLLRLPPRPMDLHHLPQLLPHPPLVLTDPHHLPQLLPHPLLVPMDRHRRLPLHQPPLRATMDRRRRRLPHPHPPPCTTSPLTTPSLQQHLRQMPMESLSSPHRPRMGGSQSQSSQATSRRMTFRK